MGRIGIVGLLTVAAALGKSEFDMDGSVVGGPATQPLTVYGTTVEGRVLKIDLGE